MALNATPRNLWENQIDSRRPPREGWGPEKFGKTGIPPSREGCFGCLRPWQGAAEPLDRFDKRPESPIQ